MRILLVEDDHRLNQSLKLGLVDEGYAVDSAFDGLEGEAFAISLPLEPAGTAVQTNFRTFTASKHKEATDMSHQMDYTERNHEGSTPYTTGYQETPGFNSYATG